MASFDLFGGLIANDDMAAPPQGLAVHRPARVSALDSSAAAALSGGGVPSTAPGQNVVPTAPTPASPPAAPANPPRAAEIAALVIGLDHPTAASHPGLNQPLPTVGTAPAPQPSGGGGAGPSGPGPGGDGRFGPPPTSGCPIPDTPPVQCCDQSGDLSQAAPGSTGGYGAGLGYGDAGVRYFDGEIRQQSDLLSSNGFGTDWGLTLTNSDWYTNFTEYCINTPSAVTPAFGNGVLVSQQPFVLKPPDQITNPSPLIVVTSSINAHYFDYDSGSHVYRAREYLQDRLIYSGGMLTYLDTAGKQLQFYDFTHSVGSSTPGGGLALQQDKAGHQTQAAYDTSGNVTSVTRVGPSGANTVTETYRYTNGGPNGQVSQVALQRQINQG